MREHEVWGEAPPLTAPTGHAPAPDVDRVVAERPLRPAQRLKLQCDDGSLRTLRGGVDSERMGEKALAGDGVVAAARPGGGRAAWW